MERKTHQTGAWVKSRRNLEQWMVDDGGLVNLLKNYFPHFTRYQRIITRCSELNHEMPTTVVEFHPSSTLFTS